MQLTKYIFVTGGVLSGVGKGVSAASLGLLLKARGFKVFAQKFDPYYNPDPGTMSPYQHGEVYVTADGGETDLDLGHYERFIDEQFLKISNVTQGRIISDVLAAERQGLYNGATIQVVPHITDYIISQLEEAARLSQADFVIAEIGGTVGDIESQPFFYAIAQFARQHKNQCFFVHAVYVPYLAASGEFKSKPAQQSLIALQGLGVLADMLLLRTDRDMPAHFAAKIAEKTLVDKDYCLVVPNVDSIYQLPLYFEAHRMAELVLERFNIKSPAPDLAAWNHYVNLLETPKKHELTLALIGKYVEYPDAYKSIVEALQISATYQQAKLNLSWIQSEGLTAAAVKKLIAAHDGAVILPGFGQRGFDGKVIAAQHLRDARVPTLGICYGFQAMVVAQALRCGIAKATSSEVSETGTFVIDLIPGKNARQIGGTLRLGASTTLLKPGSQVAAIYQASTAVERHRHRYETNPRYVSALSDEHFSFSGYDEATNLAEVLELANHPFYIGVQAHPEFSARPLRPHPLYNALVAAMIKTKTTR